MQSDTPVPRLRTRGLPVRAARARTPRSPSTPPPSIAEPNGDDARFRALVDLAPDAIVVADASGRMSLVNQQTELLFGYVRTELLGQPVELLLPERYLGAHRRHRASYMASPHTRPMGTGLQLWGRHRDGHEFPVEVSLSPVPEAAPQDGADGHFAVMCIIRDQTERQTWEQARASAERAQQEFQRLETIIEAMADAVGVYDTAGHWVRTNAALRQLLSLDADSDNCARTPEDRARQLRLRHPDGRPVAPDEYAVTRLLRGEVFTNPTPLELVLTTPDGRDVWLSVTGAPLRDETGGIIGAVTALRDVTERRQLEQRTQQALQALLAMAEVLVRAPGTMARGGESTDSATSSPHSPTVAEVAKELAALTASVLGCRRVGLVAVDPVTREQRALAVVGLTAQQEPQWWVEQAQIPRYGEGADPALLARFEAGEAIVLDMTAPPYNDLPNPYGITTSLTVPLRLGGTVVGILSLDHGSARHQYTDDERTLAEAVGQLAAVVIERERLLREREQARANELALRQATQRMDEFLGIASHELKTPITVLKTNIQLTARRLQHFQTPASLTGQMDESALADVLERLSIFMARAELSIDQLVRLVDDLLDVSRIQAGKLEFHLEAVDLVGLVHEYVEEQRELHPKRRILVVMPTGEIRVLADVGRLGQVVTNLLTNALKYSQADRPVEVRVEVAGDQARVCVRDEGPGLAPEQQERVWERFYRAPGVEVKSGSGVGLGLGLHISRTIVERHGGHVGVESIVGEGSMFWFSLPLGSALA
jgi:PAS domain S-box-containing protein